MKCLMWCVLYQTIHDNTIHYLFRYSLVEFAIIFEHQLLPSSALASPSGLPSRSFSVGWLHEREGPLRNSDSPQPFNAPGFFNQRQCNASSSIFESKRNDIKPTCIMPLSSNVGFMYPLRTTIFAKKSPVFLNDNVSRSRCAGLSMLNALWM